MVAYKYDLVSPSNAELREAKVVKSCPSIQKALSNLLGIPVRNIVARKGTGYGGGIFIYVCCNGELTHFKINQYSVAMSKPALLSYAKQIREIVMPNNKFEWEQE